MIKAAAILVALLLLLALAVSLLVRMPGRSFRGARPALTLPQQALRSVLERDVRHLAGTIGERNVVLHEQLTAAASYVEQQLANAGYKVTRQSYVVEGVTCSNLVADLRGASKPDEIVVVGAHYDSVDEAPGADDNASGTAALLALARTFASRRPARTIRFLAFVNEEPPYFQTTNMGPTRSITNGSRA